MYEEHVNDVLYMETIKVEVWETIIIYTNNGCIMAKIEFNVYQC